MKQLAILSGKGGTGKTSVAAAFAHLAHAGAKPLRAVLGTTAHFRVPALVCINKGDIYPAGTAQIEAYCRERGIEVIGHIPFDATVTAAMVQGQPVTAFGPDAPASQALVEMWQCIAARISEPKA